MKLRQFVCLLCLSLSMVACSGNPAWVGASPTGKTEKLAADACNCVYEMMGTEAGWDRQAILDEVKAIRKKSKTNWQMDILASANAAIVKGIKDEEEFSLKLDDCECMKPIHDGLLEQGVAFEEMMASLDLHCLLGAFYN